MVDCVECSVLDTDVVASVVVVVLSLDCEEIDSDNEEELVSAPGRGKMTPIVKLVDIVVSEVWDDEGTVAVSGAALDGGDTNVEECGSRLGDVIVPCCKGDACVDVSAAAVDECDMMTAEDDAPCVM